MALSERPQKTLLSEYDESELWPSTWLPLVPSAGNGSHADGSSAHRLAANSTLVADRPVPLDAYTVTERDESVASKEEGELPVQAYMRTKDRSASIQRAKAFAEEMGLANTWRILDPVELKSPVWYAEFELKREAPEDPATPTVVAIGLARVNATEQKTAELASDPGSNGGPSVPPSQLTPERLRALLAKPGGSALPGEMENTVAYLSTGELRHPPDFHWPSEESVPPFVGASTDRSGTPAADPNPQAEDWDETEEAENPQGDGQLEAAGDGEPLVRVDTLHPLSPEVNMPSTVTADMNGAAQEKEVMDALLDSDNYCQWGSLDSVGVGIELGSSKHRLFFVCNSHIVGIAGPLGDDQALEGLLYPVIGCSGSTGVAFESNFGQKPFLWHGDQRDAPNLEILNAKHDGPEVRSRQASGSWSHISSAAAASLGLPSGDDDLPPPNPPLNWESSIESLSDALSHPNLASGIDPRLALSHGGHPEGAELAMAAAVSLDLSTAAGREEQEQMDIAKAVSLSTAQDKEGQPLARMQSLSNPQRDIEGTIRASEDSLQFLLQIMKGLATEGGDHDLLENVRNSCEENGQVLKDLISRLTEELTPPGSPRQSSSSSSKRKAQEADRPRQEFLDQALRVHEGMVKALNDAAKLLEAPMPLMQAMPAPEQLVPSEADLMQIVGMLRSESDGDQMSAVHHISRTALTSKAPELLAKGGLDAMHNLFLTGREVEPESDVLLDSALALARLLIQVSDLDKLLQSAEALLEALKLLLDKSAPPALSPTVTLRSRSLSSSQQSFEDEDAIPPPPDADRSKSAPPVSPPASTPVAVPVARGYPEPGYSRKTSPRQGNGSARSASGPNSTSLGAAEIDIEEKEEEAESEVFQAKDSVKLREILAEDPVEIRFLVAESVKHFCFMLRSDYKKKQDSLPEGATLSPPEGSEWVIRTLVDLCIAIAEAVDSTMPLSDAAFLAQVSPPPTVSREYQVLKLIAVALSDLANCWGHTQVLETHQALKLLVRWLEATHKQDLVHFAMEAFRGLVTRPLLQEPDWAVASEASDGYNNHMEKAADSRQTLNAGVKLGSGLTHLVTEGCVPALLGLIYPDRPEMPREVREHAVKALHALCHGDKGSHIINQGGVPILVDMLREAALELPPHTGSAAPHASRSLAHCIADHAMCTLELLCQVSGAAMMSGDPSASFGPGASFDRSGGLTMATSLASVDGKTLGGQSLGRVFSRQNSRSHFGFGNSPGVDTVKEMVNMGVLPALSRIATMEAGQMLGNKAVSLLLRLSRFRFPQCREPFFRDEILERRPSEPALERTPPVADAMPVVTDAVIPGLAASESAENLSEALGAEVAPPLTPVMAKPQTSREALKARSFPVEVPSSAQTLIRVAKMAGNSIRKRNQSFTDRQLWNEVATDCATALTELADGDTFYLDGRRASCAQLLLEGDAVTALLQMTKAGKVAESEFDQDHFGRLVEAVKGLARLSETLLPSPPSHYPGYRSESLLTRDKRLRLSLHVLRIFFQVIKFSDTPIFLEVQTAAMRGVEVLAQDKHLHSVIVDNALQRLVSIANGGEARAKKDKGRGRRGTSGASGLEGERRASAMKALIAVGFKEGAEDLKVCGGDHKLLRAWFYLERRLEQQVVARKKLAEATMLHWEEKPREAMKSRSEIRRPRKVRSHKNIKYMSRFDSNEEICQEEQEKHERATISGSGSNADSGEGAAADSLEAEEIPEHIVPKGLPARDSPGNWSFPGPQHSPESMAMAVAPIISPSSRTSAPGGYMTPVTAAPMTNSMHDQQHDRRRPHTGGQSPPLNIRQTPGPPPAPASAPRPGFGTPSWQAAGVGIAQFFRGFSAGELRLPGVNLLQCLVGERDDISTESMQEEEAEIRWVENKMQQLLTNHSPHPRRNVDASYRGNRTTVTSSGNLSFYDRGAACVDNPSGATWSGSIDGVAVELDITGFLDVHFPAPVHQTFMAPLVIRWNPHDQRSMPNVPWVRDWGGLMMPQQTYLTFRTHEKILKKLLAKQEKKYIKAVAPVLARRASDSAQRDPKSRKEAASLAAKAAKSVEKERSPLRWILAFENSEFRGEFAKDLHDALHGMDSITALSFRGAEVNAETVSLVNLMQGLPLHVRHVTFDNILSKDAVKLLGVVLATRRSRTPAPGGNDGAGLASVRRPRSLSGAIEDGLSVAFGGRRRDNLAQQGSSINMTGLALRNHKLATTDITSLIEVLEKGDGDPTEALDQEMHLDEALYEDHQRGEAADRLVLSPRISDHSTTGLQWLDISGNKFGDNGVARVLMAVRNCHALRAVDLSNNGNLGNASKTMDALLKPQGLLACCPRLRTLYLNRNGLKNNAAIRLFEELAKADAATLRKEQSGGTAGGSGLSAEAHDPNEPQFEAKLQELGLDSNNFQCHESLSRRLKDFLGSNLHLRYLSLRHNNLTKDCALEVLIGLFQNDQFRTLHFLRLEGQLRPIESRDDGNDVMDSITGNLKTNREEFMKRREERVRELRQPEAEVLLEESRPNGSASGLFADPAMDAASVEGIRASDDGSIHSTDSEQSSEGQGRRKKQKPSERVQFNSNRGTKGERADPSLESKPMPEIENGLSQPMETAEASEQARSQREPDGKKGHRRTNSDPPRVEEPGAIEPAQGNLQAPVIFSGVLFSAPLAWGDHNQTFHPLDNGLDFEYERDMLNRTFEQAGQHIRLYFHFATTERLRSMVTLGCRALHYSGHGHPSCLTFENGQGGLQIVKPEKLKNLCQAGGRQQLQFVFVSACHSQLAGKAFVDAGVPHVVCVKKEAELRDSAALAFTRAFYEALVVGHTVASSFSIGKQAVAASPYMEAADAEEESDQFMLLPDDKDEAYHEVSIFGPDAQDSGMEAQDGIRSFSPVVDEIETGRVSAICANLPNQPEAFLGREVDMYRLLSCLLPRRMVTLVGKDGIGKSTVVTALCWYVAERNLPHFKDGVIHVRMRTPDCHKSTVEELLDMLVQVIQSVQLRLEDEVKKIKSRYPQNRTMVQLEVDRPKLYQNDVKSMKEWIFSFLADRKVLLVIDHVELMLDQDGGNGTDLKVFLSQLFARARNVKVLLTSTKAVDFTPATKGFHAGVHEKIFPLGPLSLKSTVRLFARLCPRFPTSQDQQNFVKEVLQEDDQEDLLPTSQGLNTRSQRVFYELGGGVPKKIVQVAIEDDENRDREIWAITSGQEPILSPVMTDSPAAANVSAQTHVPSAVSPHVGGQNYTTSTAPVGLLPLQNPVLMQPAPLHNPIQPIAGDQQGARRGYNNQHAGNLGFRDDTLL